MNCVLSMKDMIKTDPYSQSLEKLVLGVTILRELTYLNIVCFLSFVVLRCVCVCVYVYNCLGDREKRGEEEEGREVGWGICSIYKSLKINKGKKIF